MNGLNTYPEVRSFGAEHIIGTGRFRTNGASDPSSTYYGGSLKGLFAVTRTAQGVLRVAFSNTGFKWPNQPVIMVSQAIASGVPFMAALVGDWDNTNRRFAVTTLDAAFAAQDIASHADSWVMFTLHGNNRSRIR